MEEEEEAELEAEDPKVIKELIQLINKAGGIAQLERQLQHHRNGSVTYWHPESLEPSTTQSPIKQSLYDKILIRNHSRGPPLLDLDTANTTPSVPSANRVNLNSRSGPQNEHIEQEMESIGFIREKPKYKTISRPKSDSGKDSGDVETTVQAAPTAKYVHLQRNHNQVIQNAEKEITKSSDGNMLPFTVISPRGFAPR